MDRPHRVKYCAVCGTLLDLHVGAGHYCVVYSFATKPAKMVGNAWPKTLNSRFRDPELAETSHG